MKLRILFWLAWLVAACMPVDDLGEGSFMYPPGFRWRVRQVVHLFPAPGSDPTLPTIYDTVEFTVREVRRRPLGLSATEIWTHVDLNDPEAHSVWWVTDTALIWVQGEATSFPWSPVADSGHRYRIGERTFSSVGEVVRFLSRAAAGGGLDPLSPEELHQKTLRFPLEVGAEWVVFREPWLRVRRVVDVDTVTGPDGEEYWAWVVDAEDHEATFDTLRDWITSELWLRKLLRVTVDAFDENGQYLGKLIYRETYQLLEARP